MMTEHEKKCIGPDDFPIRVDDSPLPSCQCDGCHTPLTEEEIITLRQEMFKIYLHQVLDNARHFLKHDLMKFADVMGVLYKAQTELVQDEVARQKASTAPPIRVTLEPHLKDMLLKGKEEHEGNSERDQTG